MMTAGEPVEITGIEAKKADTSMKEKDLDQGKAQKELAPRKGAAQGGISEADRA
jgi:hypothetical protein